MWEVSRWKEVFLDVNCHTMMVRRVNGRRCILRCHVVRTNGKNIVVMQLLRVDGRLEKSVENKRVNQYTLNF